MAKSLKLPTHQNPVIRDGNDLKSIFLTPHGYDKQMRDMSEGERGAYGQAAVKIVEYLASDDDCELYWSRSQILHLKDGTVVADGLAQAADIIKKLQWSNGSSIKWKEINGADVRKDMLTTSRNLGFI
ncbi:MAG: hypothetical protein Q4F64_04265 [Corynebacterium casei]|nr:hypothetical protein [Corynebacterium casei]